MIREINARELADWLADASRPQPVLLDVREDWEFETCKIAGSTQIPMHLVPIRAGVGARLCVNLGYLKFTPASTWNPF